MLNWFYRALNNKEGFTLIEVLVVVAIIGILAALAAPSILGRIEQSRAASDEALAKTLSNAIDAWTVDMELEGAVVYYPEEFEYLYYATKVDSATKAISYDPNEDNRVVSTKYLDNNTISFLQEAAKFSDISVPGEGDFIETELDKLKTGAGWDLKAIISGRVLTIYYQVNEDDGQYNLAVLDPRAKDDD